MTARTIWMYRHAESLSNAGERTADPTTIPLSTRGWLQAEQLAQDLEAEPDHIIASPFLRSQQTAAPAKVRFDDAGAHIWPIHEFTYLDPQKCVGTSWVERKPMIDAYWGRMDPEHVEGPGAESFVMLMGRVKAFAERAAGLEAGHFMFVSHGQFMLALEIHLEQPDLAPHEAMEELFRRQAERPFPNCERLRMTAQDEALIVEGRG